MCLGGMIITMYSIVIMYVINIYIRLTGVCVLCNADVYSFVFTNVVLVIVIDLKKNF